MVTLRELPVDCSPASTDHIVLSVPTVLSRTLSTSKKSPSHPQRGRARNAPAKNLLRERMRAQHARRNGFSKCPSSSRSPPNAARRWASLIHAHQRSRAPSIAFATGRVKTRSSAPRIGYLVPFQDVSRASGAQRKASRITLCGTTTRSSPR